MGSVIWANFIGVPSKSIPAPSKFETYGCQLRHSFINTNRDSRHLKIVLSSLTRRTYAGDFKNKHLNTRDSAKIFAY